MLIVNIRKIGKVLLEKTIQKNAISYWNQYSFLCCVVLTQQIKFIKILLGWNVEKKINFKKFWEIIRKSERRVTTWKPYISTTEKNCKKIREF